MKKEITTIKTEMKFAEALEKNNLSTMSYKERAEVFITLTEQMLKLKSLCDKVEETLINPGDIKASLGEDIIIVENDNISFTFKDTEIRHFKYDENQLVPGDLPAGVVDTRVCFKGSALKKLFLKGETKGGIMNACQIDVEPVIKITENKRK